jgi:hypothetical protein
VRVYRLLLGLNGIICHFQWTSGVLHNGNNQPNHSYHLNGHVMPNVPSFRDLGMIRSNIATYSEQCQVLRLKVGKLPTLSAMHSVLVSGSCFGRRFSTTSSHHSGTTRLCGVPICRQTLLPLNISKSLLSQFVVFEMPPTNNVYRL